MVWTNIGFRDESFRAPPENGSPEDLRRSLDRLNRRIDIAMNRLDRLQGVSDVADDTSLDESDQNVFCDTDSANIKITLPTGVTGQYYRIVNTGTSGNKVRITSDDDFILGEKEVFTLNDGEALILVFSSDKGWY